MKTGSKEHILVSGGVDGIISYWNPFTNKLLATIKPEKKFSDILCLDYSKDSSKLAVAGRRKSIKIYDDEKRMMIMKLRPKDQQIPGHNNRIFSVRYDETSKLLVSGSWDMTVKVWDVNTGKVIQSIYGPEINGDAIDVNSSADIIFTGSHRSKDSLQIWSLSTGKIIGNIEWDATKPGDSSLIFGIQLEKPGNRWVIGCGSGRNETRLYEKRMDNQYAFSCGVIELPNACSSIDYSYKDNLVAIGCCDGICRLFEKVEKSKQPTIVTSEIPEKSIS